MPFCDTNSVYIQLTIEPLIRIADECRVLEGLTRQGTTKLQLQRRPLPHQFITLLEHHTHILDERCPGDWVRVYLHLTRALIVVSQALGQIDKTNRQTNRQAD